MKKLKVAYQAVANGLFLENILQELDCLNTLEVVLIAKRLLFKNIVIMPERQTPIKIHGSMINVSVTVD